jgi:hypothetical protein
MGWKLLKRYWGWILVGLVFFGWFAGNFDPLPLIILSSGAILYFLFAAPTWCGAETRDKLSCRKNSKGLILGCDLRQHKWQRVNFLIKPRQWLVAVKHVNDAAAMLGVAASFVATLWKVLVLLRGH